VSRICAISCFIDHVIVVWRHILPGLEDVVNTRKNNRLECERQEVIRARAIVIRMVYDEYKRTLDPRSWAHLPAPEQILLSEPFRNWHNSTSDLDPAIRADCISQLPTIISKWRNELRDKLASSVPIQRIFLDHTHVEPEYRPPILSNLELATSVFTCHGCWVDSYNSGICLIGWDDIANHLSCPRMVCVGNDGLAPSGIGHYTATVIMHLLDLDPKTVTVKELDKTDARFWCVKCRDPWHRHQQRHNTFTWRECVRFSVNSILAFGLHIIQVAHAIENERKHRSKNCWELLTVQASIIVRRHERPVDVAGDKSWSCTHCAVHLHHRVTRRAAIVHTKEMFDTVPSTCIS
jgi:hypothetical protein